MASFEEYVEFSLLNECVNKDDTVAVERITQEFMAYDEHKFMLQWFWTRLCETALKNRSLPMLKVLLAPKSIAYNLADLTTNIILIKAAVKSDLMESVKFLHSEGVPLYFPDELILSGHSWSALVECVKNNKVEVLKYLLGLKYLDKNPDKKETLLMLCCDELNIECLKIVLNTELINTINHQETKGKYSALHYCIDGGYCEQWGFGIGGKPGRVLDCVKLLVEAGADINLYDIEWKTPVMLAAQRGMVTVVIYLANIGAHLDIEKYQCTLLHCLAWSKSKADSYDECVQLLITHGLAINTLNISEETPLSLAVCNGNVEMAKSLIKSNCDANIQVGGDLATALLESVRRHETAIAEILIQAGCDVNRTDKNGVTPLMKCVETDNLVLVKQLIAHGVSVNAKDKEGCFALDYLFRPYHHRNNRSSSSDIVKIMIEAGADIHKCNNLLCKAINNGDYETASLLIEHGIDVNTVDINGDNPLTLASEKNNLELVTLLISKDCDVNHQNLIGKAALHKAIEGSGKVINILMHATLLMEEAALKRSITENLLKAGADVNHCDNRRQTPLMSAARTLYRSVLECLLNAGADVNKTDTDGRSAIHGIMDGRSMVSPFRDRAWINCLKLLLINKFQACLDTPGKYRQTLFQWLLEQKEADLIWYLVTENCSLKSLNRRMITNKFRFPDTLRLFKILFESGAPKCEIETIIWPPSRHNLMHGELEDKHQLDEFREFCNLRSLKSRCRREIRNSIGPGISSKITQVGLPQYIQDYVVMKDLIPEKYFTLVLQDTDDEE